VCSSDLRAQPFAPTALADVLADALRDLAVVISESGARIEAGALPVVTGDRRQLAQLLENLLANAIKFGAPGRPPQIEIGAAPPQSPGAPWTVSVRDRGIGIDPKHFERIFVIFQRLHSEGAYPGTGVGLALCKKIVERHGGRIWVESAPGQGAIFLFTLPAGAADVSAAAGSSSAA
jgi:light-regulated signal transduction histidine kinase (bacteriophytochrome)